MKKATTTLLAILISFHLSAAHNRAGEITYQRIQPYTVTVGSAVTNYYKYRITLTRYTDDGVGIADRCADTINFGDGTKGVAYRTNGPAGNCNCANGTVQIPCGELIINQGSYKVKKNIYVIEHVYPGPGNYLIYSYDPNRNQGVVNIPNSVTQPFFIESRLIITSAFGANSSPVLTNPPLGAGYLGICYYHNPFAVDADGDSLSYLVTPCRGVGGGEPPGYTYPPGNYSMSQAGLLEWCSPQQQGEYNIAYMVKEWRKNSHNVYQMLGYVLRDMQIVVGIGAVGINKNENDNRTVLFPNPVNEKLFFDLGFSPENSAQITIYSVSGRLMKKISVSPGNAILETETIDLPPGLYFALIESGLYSQQLKFSKE